MSNIKLYYFNMPGRAESIRQALTIGGIPFEDVRLAGPEFGEKKAAGFFKFGQVPAIEIDGKVYGQSLAILSWVGRQAKLVPTDSIQLLRVEELLNFHQDFTAAIIPIWFNKNEEEKKTQAQDFYQTKGK